MDSDGRYRRESFSARMEDLSDGVVAVSVSGEVDQLTVPCLTPVIRAALDCAARLVLVDMSRVSFLSSAGLAVLVESANRARTAGQQLALVAGNHPVTRAMTVTGLDSIIALYPSRDAAMADHPVDDRSRSVDR